MANYYDLTARFDTRASFYGKAKLIEDDDFITLISYDTEILKQSKSDGKIEWICQDESCYTLTTNRHINEFLKQFTNEKAKTKSEILKAIKGA